MRDGTAHAPQTFLRRRAPRDAGTHRRTLIGPFGLADQASQGAGGECTAPFAYATRAPGRGGSYQSPTPGAGERSQMCESRQRLDRCRKYVPRPEAKPKALEAT